MNEQKIVQAMIDFVEKKEREVQNGKLSSTPQKSDIVKSILDELERVMADENQ